MPRKSKKKVGRPVDQQLIQRRREEILCAATKTFAQRGYAGTDVELIAQKVKVSKGTIYRYFPSKRELFLATVDRTMVALKEAVDQVVEPLEDPLDKISHGIRAYLGFFDDHPEFIELMIQERAAFKDRQKPTYAVHREANLEPWAELYRDLIDQKRIRKVDVNRLLEVMNCFLYGTIFAHVFGGTSTTLKDKTNDIIDVIFQGILTPQEIKSRKKK